MSEATEMAVEETTTTAPTSVLDAPPVVRLSAPTGLVGDVGACRRRR